MLVVVGIGVIISNHQGKILVGKRSSKHAPYWSIFGGHLEAGETFEAGAIREIAEEVGIQIIDPHVFGLSNNLTTYQEEGKHTISVCLHAEYTGEPAPRIMEPEKCAQLMWVDPNNLPEPHFEASRTAIALWQQGQFYCASR